MGLFGAALGYNVAEAIRSTAVLRDKLERSSAVTAQPTDP